MKLSTAEMSFQSKTVNTKRKKIKLKRTKTQKYMNTQRI